MGDVRRSDGNGQDHSARPLRTCYLAGGLRGGSGRDTVVDDHRDAPVERNRDVVAAEAFRSALQFGPLGGLHGGYVPVGEVRLAHHVFVDDPHIAFPDSAERELGVRRHAELAHQKHVEGSVQRPGDFESHRDTASRQTQHHHVVAP